MPNSFGGNVFCPTRSSTCCLGASNCLVAHKPHLRQPAALELPAVWLLTNLISVVHKAKYRRSIAGTIMTAANSNDFAALQSQCFPEPGTSSASLRPSIPVPPPPVPTRSPAISFRKLTKSVETIDVGDSDVEMIAHPRKADRLSTNLVSVHHMPDPQRRHQQQHQI